MFFDKIFTHVVFYKGKNMQLITYGLYYGIAGFFYFAFLLTGLTITGHNISMNSAFFIVLLLTVGLIASSKLLYWLYNIKRLWRDPVSVINETGFVFFGGIIGIILVLAIVPFQGIDRLTLLDFAFLLLPVAQIFLRLGCASYGCCYGHPYQGPMACVHHDTQAKSFRMIGNTPVHPTQFYSLLKAFFLLVALTAIFFRFPMHGIAITFWLILYPMMRFFVDFTRDYTSHNIPYFGGFRISQIISVVLFFLGIVSLFIITTNTEYKMDYSLYQSVVIFLKFCPIAALAGVIFTLCFGYQGSKLGYYIAPESP